MGYRGPEEPSDPVEPMQFMIYKYIEIHHNYPFITIHGLRPHFPNLIGSMEPIETLLTKLLKNLRVVYPCELKPR